VGNNPRFGAYNALLQEAASLHVRVRSFRTGDSLSFGAAQIAVLAPFPNYQPGPEPTNNDSLVLHMSYGATSVMLEGDAEAPVEDEMIAQAMLPEQDSQVRCSRWAIMAASPPRGRSFWPAWLRSGPSSPAGCTTVTAIRVRRCWKSCRPRMSAPIARI